jgi:hypothetical protein
MFEERRHNGRNSLRGRLTSTRAFCSVKNARFAGFSDMSGSESSA